MLGGVPGGPSGLRRFGGRGACSGRLAGMRWASRGASGFGRENAMGCLALCKRCWSVSEGVLWTVYAQEVW